MKQNKSPFKWDGFLRAHEVFNLRLAADVVVLSACQTGLGKEIRGEGLVGLTRGFMYAGAPRVVISLWNINDAATAEGPVLLSILCLSFSDHRGSPSLNPTMHLGRRKLSR